MWSPRVSGRGAPTTRTASRTRAPTTSCAASPTLASTSPQVKTIIWCEKHPARVQYSSMRSGSILREGQKGQRTTAVRIMARETALVACMFSSSVLSVTRNQKGVLCCDRCRRQSCCKRRRSRYGCRTSRPTRCRLMAQRAIAMRTCPRTRPVRLAPLPRRLAEPLAHCCYV